MTNVHSEVKKPKKNKTIIQNITINNITNINHIHINSYLCEDSSMLTDDDWIEIFQKLDKIIPAYVQKIHVDTEVNRNVLIQNLNSDYYRVVNNNALEYEEEQQVLSRLLSFHVSDIEDKLYKMKRQGRIPMILHDRISNILTCIRVEPKQNKAAKRDIKRVLLNGRFIIGNQLKHLMIHM